MDQNKSKQPSDRKPDEDSQEKSSLRQESKSEQIDELTNAQEVLHPTGIPETTGGWFTEVSDEENKRVSQPNEEIQHPTGSPDLTGGWFVQEQKSARPMQSVEETRASQRSPESRSQKSTQAKPLSSEQKQQNASLLKRVDEVDSEATRVISSAYHINSSHPQSRSNTKQIHQRRKTFFTRIKLFFRSVFNPDKKGSACLLTGIIAFLFFSVIVLLGLLSFSIYKYFSIASSLPEIDDLQGQASQFETTRILDRNGNLLYELVDPDAGRRTFIPLENISPNLIAATIATEDQDYYNHPGFDAFAILRALIQNYTTGETVSGASTITQQLARAILLSPTERNEKSVDRKAKEIVLAAEITRKYDKDEILELYLNEIYYGNQAYGIEAAAETYFNTTADRLTLGQASFLAGLPQAPSVYDVFSNPEETFNRHHDVVVLMFQLSQEKNCIEVSNNVQPICVDATDAAEAIDEVNSYAFVPHTYIMNYPHWVNYIRTLLEKEYDSQTIYRSGFTITTTLDPVLQDEAEKMVKRQVLSLADSHVTDGALVALDPDSGEILAMVGSADFYDEKIAGQINMAISPRQPGSSIKPLTYLAAFEKGWTPATLIWDVPSEFSPSGLAEDNSPRYIPVNYDDRFHGPVLLRTALANSYNIPAVKTLQFVGIYDNPDIPGKDGLISMAERLGITTLEGDDYGLSLTLGGGDVTLLELTNAYGIVANGGRKISPFAIRKIVDYKGNTIFEKEINPSDQVIRQEHAFLLSSILSDNQARSPMFGSDSVLNLPFQAAVKTGTTNDFRDNWTIGYTPDIVVGVWAGNADYSPMQHTTGLSGAAPIWSEFMQFAIQDLVDNQPAPFVKPAGVVERKICAVSGSEPSEWCPKEITEFFASDQLPQTPEKDLWIKTKIDTWTGLKASQACSDFSEEKYTLNVSDPWAIEWLKNSSSGQEWLAGLNLAGSITFLPQRDCEPGDARPLIEFPGLSDYQWINSSPIDIYAIAAATQNFSSFHLEYGLGDEPDIWYRLIEHQETPVTTPTNIYTLDVSELPQGVITLRLIVNSSTGTSAETMLHLNLNVPTQTPTLTPVPSETPFPTFTATIPSSETPSPTPTE